MLQRIPWVGCFFFPGHMPALLAGRGGLYGIDLWDLGRWICGFHIGATHTHI